MDSTSTRECHNVPEFTEVPCSKASMTLWGPSLHLSACRLLTMLTHRPVTKGKSTANPVVLVNWQEAVWQELFSSLQAKHVICPFSSQRKRKKRLILEYNVLSPCTSTWHVWVTPGMNSALLTSSMRQPAATMHGGWLSASLPHAALLGNWTHVSGPV